MSLIIGDALVAGGIAGAPEPGTAEDAMCWPRGLSETPMEHARGRVRGMFCAKRGESVLATTCNVRRVVVFAPQ